MLPCASAQDGVRAAKRIYIAADDHTDYMWTGDEQQYREAFVETIDHYLDLADQTDGHPEDYQSRWNCDGLLWFREYEQHRSGQQVARLVARIKSGHVSIPMTMLVSCYGATPTEAVLRGLYYGGIVERKYDLRIPIAVAMENQTIPLGLGMLWAGSGIRYSWKGICGCASKLAASGSQRDHDVYWWVGPDGSRILMKWYSLVQPLKRGVYWNEGPGGYAEARHPELAIEFVDSDPEFRKRNPHQVLGLFGQGWDAMKTVVPLDDPKNSFPAVARRMSTKERRVIVSNEHDYFADLVATHGDDLPEVSCAFGNEWELYTASLAEVSASVKRATEKLRTAEAMAAIVARHQPDFADDMKEMRHQAWIAFGLYWEHDWTADGPISKQRRAAWQRKIAGQITDYVDRLYERAADALGKLIDPPQASSQDSIFVFNPLAWNRSDYVDFPLGTEKHDWIVVTDQPDENISSQTWQRDGTWYLRFWAVDIPACGYRLFFLRERTEHSRSASPSIRAEGSQIRSSRHELTVGNNGSIRGWRCNRLGKTLIAENQSCNDLEAAKGWVQVESSGAVSTTLRIDVARPIARATRITLFESIDRIEIENTIRESFSDVESWRYEFNLKQATTIHEEVGAILRAATKSEGGDYADRNARTDWLTLNHFVTMHDDSAAVTLSNRDCLFFHLGERTTEPMDPSAHTLHVLAGGQVDGQRLGIPNQGNDRLFTQRFAMRADDPAAAADRARSMRFALEHQNPLVAHPVAAGQGVLDGPRHSDLQIDSDSVILWAWKPPEHRAGQGTIVRLWNLSAAPANYRLSRDKPIQSCVKTTHVETDVESMEVVEGTVFETLPPGGMRTMRIR